MRSAVRDASSESRSQFIPRSGVSAANTSRAWRSAVGARPRATRTRTRRRGPALRALPCACAPLRQRDVVLDHQIERQPLDLEPGARLQGLRPLQLARAHGRIDALLDLALRVDAEVLQELANGKIERLVVHGVTLKT